MKILNRIERYFARYQALTILIMVSLVRNVRIMMSVVVVIVNCALIADTVRMNDRNVSGVPLVYQ